MGLSKEGIMNSLQDLYGDSVTAADIRAWCALNDCNYQTVTNKISDLKVGRGRWNLTAQQLEQTFQAPAALPAVEQNLIPAKDDTFVKFGNYNDLKKVIQSRVFYPTFITGLSGNGKTFSVEQACAALGRELIRVNITIETDEDDLIGGFRLVDWADIIRKTFYDGGIEDIISTRRLVHIAKAYAIFGNKEKAMQVCINRFDDDTKQAFLELYDKVDEDFDITATDSDSSVDQEIAS